MHSFTKQNLLIAYYVSCTVPGTRAGVNQQLAPMWPNPPVFAWPFTEK